MGRRHGEGRARYGSNTKGEVAADQYGATSANGNDEELTTFDVIAISMVFIIIILVIVLACRDKKCPKCKSMP